MAPEWQRDSLLDRSRDIPTVAMDRSVDDAAMHDRTP